MMRIFPMLLLVVGCGACADTGAGADTFDGRSLRLTDERSDKTQPAPLIVALHPFLGTPKSMQAKSRFDALARRHGFAVVYPSGKRRRWNDGRSPRNRVDDVGYVSALVATLVADGVADPKRVFMAGHSNGGGMAMRMACDRPDLTAGIAVIATKLPSAYPCEGGQPVPTILFHGTADPIAPHEGRPEGARLGATLSADETIANWSSRNGCSAAGSPDVIDRKDDGTSVNVTRYTGCAAALTHVVIDGHGHAWPGAGARLPRLQGPASEEVDATEMTWAFFDSLP